MNLFGEYCIQLKQTLSRSGAVGGVLSLVARNVETNAPPDQVLIKAYRFDPRVEKERRELGWKNSVPLIEISKLLAA
jgi:hypothetical protein